MRREVAWADQSGEGTGTRGAASRRGRMGVHRAGAGGYARLGWPAARNARTGRDGVWMWGCGLRSAGWHGRQVQVGGPRGLRVAAGGLLRDCCCLAAGATPLPPAGSAEGMGVMNESD